MNKFNVLIGALLILFTVSCEGPEGPPGFDGRDGEDGLDAPLTEVFEETANFSYNAEGNIWRSNQLSYQILGNNDVVFLVYISLENGFYTPLPASVFDEFGEFQYIFDHTFDTVELQIIGDNDLSTLEAADTQNIPVRVVIIPADIIATMTAEQLSNINAMMNLKDVNIQDIQAIIRE
ncbi:hypothetical protein LV716_00675 [Flagellimonas sp. HMM57]|uniref:hypothetical protein n=1 Tax=unclassified Flagellimonas TaxID=2644544 RepID=UPI0013D23308|nr:MULTISPECIES: hypothetical protein [unclassified Flagellimonas]UII76337.1 hypothetical protein LV716_00675 [Flagellimonas sp. HMM57]